jgi:hypothetical protein
MLSKKNKDLLKLAGAIFAAVVLAFAFMRAKKSSEVSKQPLTASLQSEVKNLLTA